MTVAPQISQWLNLAVNLIRAQCKRAQSLTPNSRVMSLINKGVWPECRPQSQSPILFSTGIQLTSFLKWVKPNTGDSKLPLKKALCLFGHCPNSLCPSDVIRALWGTFWAMFFHCKNPSSQFEIKCLQDKPSGKLSHPLPQKNDLRKFSFESERGKKRQTILASAYPMMQNSVLLYKFVPGLDYSYF